MADKPKPVKPTETKFVKGSLNKKSISIKERVEKELSQLLVDLDKDYDYKRNRDQFISQDYKSINDRVKKRIEKIMKDCNLDIVEVEN